MGPDHRAEPAATTTGAFLAPTPYRVRTRFQETPDTVTLVLAPRAGGKVPSFAPGQFNMLYAFRVGESAISISGDPTEPAAVVHTIRSVGKVTQALAALQTGDMLGVRGPYGTGWPVERARGKDVVIVAGGLGLPPLRPVLYEILSHRSDYRRVEVVYGARTPKDLVYYPEIQRWRARGDLRFQVTVDAAGTDWYGDVGIVTQRLPDIRFEPRESVAFLCGPEIMMRSSAKDLLASGVSADHIWVSMERNMKCAVAQCGHCQFGPYLLCRNGPVLSYREVGPYLGIREV